MQTGATVTKANQTNLLWPSLLPTVNIVCSELYRFVRLGGCN